MTKRVADVLIETLQAAGVKTCYGVVGDTLNRIASAIDRSEIDWIHMRHEEAGVVLSHPRLYRLPLLSASMALKLLPRFLVYNRLNTWTRGREMPEAPRETFHAWWAKNRGRGRPQG